MERAAKNSQHLPSAGGSPGCDDGVGTPSKTDKEMKLIGLRTCGLPFFHICINISILTDENEHPESSACMEQ